MAAESQQERAEEAVKIEDVDTFFDGSNERLVRDVVVGSGEGFPGPDFRKNVLAQHARAFVAEGVAEALDLVNFAHGFDLKSEADRADFMDAIRAGGVLALIDITTHTEDYWKALFGEDDEAEEEEEA